jgi:hypothetical protein
MAKSLPAASASTTITDKLDLSDRPIFLLNTRESNTGNAAAAEVISLKHKRLFTKLSKGWEQYPAAKPRVFDCN